MNKEHRDGNEFDFLIGKSIIKVEKEETYIDIFKLICSDGTIIYIETNDGCGGCGNGWSSFEDLKKLEENNNVITNIKTEYTTYYDYPEDFTMFVYYEDGTINQLYGDDGYGNGYYGGGFYITIKKVGEDNE